MTKTLDVINNEDAKDKVSDVKIFGKDIWKLISKASSKEEGWMKSTKALDTKGGVIVQVSTQQGENVAEALTFVPKHYVEKNDIVPYDTPLCELNGDLKIKKLVVPFSTLSKWTDISLLVMDITNEKDVEVLSIEPLPGPPQQGPFYIITVAI